MANIIPKALKNVDIISAANLEEFKFLDADAFIESNKVIDQASQSALKNEPPSASIRPDENELRLRQLLSQLAIRATNRLNDTTGMILNAVRAIDVVTDKAKLDNAVKNFRSDVEAEGRGDLDNLRALQTHFRTENSDFESFKKENGLTRSAVYKESAWNTTGWLGICLVIEVIMNMNLLADASNFGLLGGASLAVIISSLNISIGLILGFFVLPQKNHINTRSARVGFIGFIVGLALVVCFNLLIAHYREVLILDPANSGSLAVASFINGMFNLTDVLSIFLFLIGVLICFFAIRTGYTQNDRYPGYAAQDKKMKQIASNFYHERQAQIDRFNTQLLDAFKNVNSKQANIVMSYKKFNTLSTTFDTQLNLYRDYINDLKQTGVRAITLYRATNSSNRADEAPSYFDDLIEIEFETVPIPARYNEIGEELGRAVEDTGMLLPVLEGEFIQAKDDHQRILHEVTIE